MWVKKFTFDDIAERAVFEGPVTIVHWPDLTGKKGTTMLADRVIADFESDSSPVIGGKAADQTQMTLKQFIASGHVKIVTADANIDATEVSYDPATELLHATGTPDDLVHVTDNRGRGDASFQEVWIDTRTNEVKRVIGFNGQARQ